MRAEKVRRLLCNTLYTDMEFKRKMVVYLVKTGGKSTFYDNRLPFETHEGFLMIVDMGRHGCVRLEIGSV